MQYVFVSLITLILICTHGIAYCQGRVDAYKDSANIVSGKK